MKSYVRYACLGSTALLRFPHLMPDSEKKGFKPDFSTMPPEVAEYMMPQPASATKH